MQKSSGRKDEGLGLDVLAGHIRRGEVDTVLVVFPDIYGRLMGKRLTGHYFLEHATSDGTHACNYLLTLNIEMDPLEGFALASWDKGFGDFEMRLDLSSIRLLPWQKGAAMVICDLHHASGESVGESPRGVLRRQLERVDDAGVKCYTASELEFFLFNNTYEAAAAGGYAALTPSSDYRIDYHTMQPARDEAIMRALRQQTSREQMGAGVSVESSKGEWGRGQHELNFEYAEPMVMADHHVVFKQGAREIAQQQGKSISFMPKIAANDAGSSCHIHISVFRGGENLFRDPAGGGRSEYFRHFLGGLLKYGRELSYFFAPSINAYKRYQAGSWAPTKMAWAEDNRTTGYRVVGEGESLRIENRMPGSDTNPYLAFAAMIAAGLAGVEEKSECGEAYQGNAYIDPKLAGLPGSLREAADLLDGSTMARKSFGDEVIDFYALTARHEVRAFDGAVTDWERRRYFERI